MIKYSFQNRTNTDTAPNMDDIYSDFERVQQDSNSIAWVKVEILDDDYGESDDAEYKTMRIFFTDDEPNREDIPLETEDTAMRMNSLDIKSDNKERRGVDKQDVQLSCPSPSHSPRAPATVVQARDMCVSPVREEKHKELKRKKTNARQRAYYQRQKNLKKKAEIIKKVPKSNAERQREFRQRKAEKSYVDMKRRKLCSNEENVVQEQNRANTDTVSNMDNKCSDLAKVPAIQQLLPPTHAEVKQEPVDEEVHEKVSAIYQLLPPTHAEVKQEPVDEEVHDEIDIEEHAIETLKVEVEDSDDQHSGARRGLWSQIEPVSTQKVLAMHQSLPPTHAEVKQEPVDEEVPESTSAVHHLLCSTDFEVKSEPTDDVHQDMELSTSSTTQVERRPD